MYTRLPGHHAKFCFFNSPHQMTPLHKAAVQGHVDTLQYLLDKGADIDIKDCNGVSE